MTIGRRVLRRHGSVRTGADPAVTALARRWLTVTAPAAGTAQDLLCSPVGLWNALAVMAAGARGRTAAEIGALLAVPAGRAACGLAALDAELAGTDALVRGTALWSRVPVSEEFGRALPGVEIGGLDRDRADAWVRRSTGGLLDRVPVPVRPETVALLVDVLALRARWAEPFPAWLTGEGTFTDGAGDRHRCRLMRRRLDPPDLRDLDGGAEGGGTTLVELGCRPGPTGSGARLRIALGHPDATPADTLAACLTGWGRGRAPAVDEAHLALPRFELRRTTDLIAPLSALGVRRLFTEGAELDRIGPEPLYVTDAAQDVVVRVAELGVEAAAATAVVAAPGSAPSVPRRVRRVVCDRPFALALLDAAGRVPLLLGWVATAPRDPGEVAVAG